MSIFMLEFRKVFRSVNVYSCFYSKTLPTYYMGPFWTKRTKRIMRAEQKYTEKSESQAFHFQPKLSFQNRGIHHPDFVAEGIGKQEIQMSILDASFDVCMSSAYFSTVYGVLRKNLINVFISHGCLLPHLKTFCLIPRLTHMDPHLQISVLPEE